ncbi:hypothetical protein H5410_021802 [Solanum commersonii]|uniref:Uncharacterized protein n=1 Tax=Solanum commersonii TaxID=4109 RepID=A0A9J5ZCD1_SOLCO|nr:hypothetical protein H5410_021802 [Solanum commersonii]
MVLVRSERLDSGPFPNCITGEFDVDLYDDPCDELSIAPYDGPLPEADLPLSLHLIMKSTVRTFLNGLRCQTLGYFKWYKDTYLIRVMELPENKVKYWKAKWYKDTYLSRVMEFPENKVEYWKANFIDGLPPLFAEKVRKTLRDGHGEIPYKDLTYGKIIGTCTQEGLNLCNELKMDRQLKMDKLKEKSQLGDFCAQFGLPSLIAKDGNKDFLTID